MIQDSNNHYDDDGRFHTLIPWCKGNLTPVNHAMERLVKRKESLNALDEYSFISQKYCRFYEYKQSEPKRKLRTHKKPKSQSKLSSLFFSQSIGCLSNHSQTPPELSVPFCRQLWVPGIFGSQLSWNRSFDTFLATQLRFFSWQYSSFRSLLTESYPYPVSSNFTRFIQKPPRLDLQDS